MQLNRRVCSLALILMFAPLLGAAPARWPQFRGPNAQGVADEQNPPTQFGPDTNLLWSIPLPPGHSCPCIWDDRIFLTALERNKLLTLCIRRSDGQILWQQPAPAEKLERINRTNSLATPTPVTDGQRVYVFFGSFGVLAYDFDGKELWRKPLSIENVRHGTAASPVLAAGRLIVNGDQEDMKSFIIALDPASGQTVWEVRRPACFSSHTTPIYWKRDSADEIILAGSIRVVAYDLKDGSERWGCRGLEAISICPTPALGDGILFAMSQSMGEDKLPDYASLIRQADKNGDGKLTFNESPKLVRDVFSILDRNHDGLLTQEEWDLHFKTFTQAESGLFAIRVPDRGDVTATHILWKQKRGIPEVASPLCYRGRIFIIRSGGFASCFDARTGRPFYQSQRVGAEGQYFASPVAADGRIYVASNSGMVSVLAAGDELKVLARNDLGEPITATPAIADNKLYIRSAGHLWAFGPK